MQGAGVDLVVDHVGPEEARRRGAVAAEPVQRDGVLERREQRARRQRRQLHPAHFVPVAEHQQRGRVHCKINVVMLF